MTSQGDTQLSRRERQIMDIVYGLSEASAAQVRESMSDAPGYSTVRKLLTILVEKGHLKHRLQGGKYFYRPTKRRDRAGRSALLRVLDTFFDGSIEKAVTTLVSNGRKVSDEELHRLGELIEEARERSND